MYVKPQPQLQRLYKGNPVVLLLQPTAHTGDAKRKRIWSVQLGS